MIKHIIIIDWLGTIIRMEAPTAIVHNARYDEQDLAILQNA